MEGAVTIINIKIKINNLETKGWEPGHFLGMKKNSKIVAMMLMSVLIDPFNAIIESVA